MATKKAPAVAYTKETLIDSAQAFGVTSEVMAGALYGIKEQITQDQAIKLIKEFLTRPVQK